jgi:hypothetical protein
MLFGGIIERDKKTINAQRGNTLMLSMRASCIGKRITLYADYQRARCRGREFIRSREARLFDVRPRQTDMDAPSTRYGETGGLGKKATSSTETQAAMNDPCSRFASDAQGSSACLRCGRLWIEHSIDAQGPELLQIVRDAISRQFARRSK